MNIDFPPPSNGVYNNAGSSRQLANYCEHEDLQRMEQGIYTEGFFNLTDDNVYKSHVIKDIDGNIGQLLKTDAKFYAVHVSPSEKELQAMGSTEKRLRTKHEPTNETTSRVKGRKMQSTTKTDAASLDATAPTPTPAPATKRNVDGGP